MMNFIEPPKTLWETNGKYLIGWVFKFSGLVFVIINSFLLINLHLNRKPINLWTMLFAELVLFAILGTIIVLSAQNEYNLNEKLISIVTFDIADGFENLQSLYGRGKATGLKQRWICGLYNGEKFTINIKFRKGLYGYNDTQGYQIMLKTDKTTKQSISTKESYSMSQIKTLKDWGYMITVPYKYALVSGKFEPKIYLDKIENCIE